ncbi:MAG: hypothetical protein ACOCSR_00555 [Wenzhouxiangella sp.]
MNRSAPYRQELSAGWWLHHSGYRRYMLRELTCIWIGAWAVVLIVAAFRLGQGGQSARAFLEALGSPIGVVFQLATLAFALYHTITWFALAPRTMPIWRGEEKVPDSWVKLAHYLAWLIISAGVIAWLGGWL